MRNSLTLKTALILPLALATAFIAVPVQAYISSTDSVSVKIDQRDLKTQVGVERIYKRLATKAENTCRNSGTRSLKAKAIEKNCTRILLDSFVADLDNVSLTTYHSGKVSG